VSDARACRDRGVLESQLPPLKDLSQELGLSVTRLREQLQIAKTLGLVDARPKVGVRRLDYKFGPPVTQSLFYAVALDWKYFVAFSDLRNHIESAYWFDAIEQLTSQDHDRLRDLVRNAWEKLRGFPVHIPHAEHREMHMLFFKRLDNPFVIGILEAYWDSYEAVGLNLYTDYEYLEQVWRYHEQIVEAVCNGEFEKSFQALKEHTDLLFHRGDTDLESKDVLDETVSR
jgi:DNA-binding FadR family transcriptional regulator